MHAKIIERECKKLEENDIIPVNQEPRIVQSNSYVAKSKKMNDQKNSMVERVTFNSGPLGLSFSPKGIVKKIEPGSQADWLGVMIGWKILYVNEIKACDGKSINQVISQVKRSNKEIVIVFQKEFLKVGDIVRAQPQSGRNQKKLIGKIQKVNDGSYYIKFDIGAVRTQCPCDEVLPWHPVRIHYSDQDKPSNRVNDYMMLNHCRACGTSLNENDNFCSECGTSNGPLQKHTNMDNVYKIGIFGASAVGKSTISRRYMNDAIINEEKKI